MAQFFNELESALQDGTIDDVKHKEISQKYGIDWNKWKIPIKSCSPAPPHNVPQWGMDHKRDVTIYAILDIPLNRETRPYGLPKFPIAPITNIDSLLPNNAATDASDTHPYWK